VDSKAGGCVFSNCFALTAAGNRQVVSVHLGGCLVFCHRVVACGQIRQGIAAVGEITVGYGLAVLLRAGDGKCSAFGHSCILRRLRDRQVAGLTGIRVGNDRFGILSGNNRNSFTAAAHRQVVSVHLNIVDILSNRIRTHGKRQGCAFPILQRNVRAVIILTRYCDLESLISLYARNSLGDGQAAGIQRIGDGGFVAGDRRSRGIVGNTCFSDLIDVGRSIALEHRQTNKGMRPVILSIQRDGLPGYGAVVPVQGYRNAIRAQPKEIVVILPDLLDDQIGFVAVSVIEYDRRAVQVIRNREGSVTVIGNGELYGMTSRIVDIAGDGSRYFLNVVGLFTHVIFIENKGVQEHASVFVVLALGDNSALFVQHAEGEIVLLQFSAFQPLDGGKLVRTGRMIFVCKGCPLLLVGNDGARSTSSSGGKAADCILGNGVGSAVGKIGDDGRFARFEFYSAVAVGKGNRLGSGRTVLHGICAVQRHIGAILHVNKEAKFLRLMVFNRAVHRRLGDLQRAGIELIGDGQVTICGAIHSVGYNHLIAGFRYRNHQRMRRGIIDHLIQIALLLPNGIGVCAGLLEGDFTKLERCASAAGRRDGNGVLRGHGRIAGVGSQRKGKGIPRLKISAFQHLGAGYHQLVCLDQLILMHNHIGRRSGGIHLFHASNLLAVLGDHCTRITIIIIRVGHRDHRRNGLIIRLLEGGNIFRGGIVTDNAFHISRCLNIPAARLPLHLHGADSVFCYRNGECCGFHLRRSAVILFDAIEEVGGIVQRNFMHATAQISAVV